MLEIRSKLFRVIFLNLSAPDFPKAASIGRGYCKITSVYAKRFASKQFHIEQHPGEMGVGFLRGNRNIYVRRHKLNAASHMGSIFIYTQHGHLVSPRCIDIIHPIRCCPLAQLHRRFSKKDRMEIKSRAPAGSCANTVLCVLVLSVIYASAR